MLVAMAAMFVAALAVPDAFGGHGVLFGVAFLFVTRHAPDALRARSARRPDLLAAILRIAPSALVGAALIIVAGFVDGGLKPIALAGRARRRLRRAAPPWGARLARAAGALHRASRADRDHRDRRVPDRHRPRRESQRAQHRRDRRRRARVRSRDLVLAGVLRLLPDPRPADPGRPKRRERAALARDVYTYLHLPMVAGIVLFAFAMKATLADVGGELATIPAFGLCGGPALYLLAFVALRVRVSRTLGRGRLIAAIACAALWPVADGRAGARRAHAGNDRLARASRLRVHLVARGARTDTCAQSVCVIRRSTTTERD